MDSFAKADDAKITNGLRASCRKICGMRFKKHIFEVSGLNIRSLRGISSEDFEKLPDYFKEDLKAAQVLESNELLSPVDSIEERRRKGVILETINEVKMMFSNVTPVKSQICERALSVLSPYLDRSARIGRA